MAQGLIGGDPAQIAATSASLKKLGSLLEGSMAPLVGMVTPAVWVGADADEFRSAALKGLQQRCQSASGLALRLSSAMAGDAQAQKQVSSS